MYYLRIEKLKQIEKTASYQKLERKSIVYRNFSKITEMMINLEKSECLEKTDKKNEKVITSRYDY